MPDWLIAGPGAVDELVALLLEGHRAIPVLESLDQHCSLSAYSQNGRRAS